MTKYQSLPPCAIMAEAVALPVAQVSLTHRIVLGEQALPVRSELAVDDARNVMRVSRSSALMARLNGRVRYVDDGINAFHVEPFARNSHAHIGLVLVIGVNDLDFDVLVAGREILRRHARGFHRTHTVRVLKHTGNIR